MPDTSSQSSKKERLVLRSGVGAGKALRTQSSAEVVDSWEEAEEKEEQAEQAEQEKENEKTSVEPQPETAESGAEVVEQPVEVGIQNTPALESAEGEEPEHV
jgi:transcriptional repressor NF-X1